MVVETNILNHFMHRPYTDTDIGQTIKGIRIVDRFIKFVPNIRKL